ncbi:MAG: DUF3086 domain-containing protein [Microcoleaceae cyanobacterium MO_207.B10]|nr:DUF3086 domain-containing protein [Microcoleaceae cyanobacterium MO_207.B10]
MHSDETQPQQQKEKSPEIPATSYNLNEVVPSPWDQDNEVVTSPWDQDEEVDIQPTAADDQAAQSFDDGISQPVDNYTDDNTEEYANFTEEPEISPVPEAQPTSPIIENTETELATQVTKLQDQKQSLKAEIAALQGTKAKLQQEMMAQTEAMGRLVPEALSQLEQRRQGLQIEVEKLQRRKERIQKEMRTTFAGTSQDLAIRIQGFKDYLVGSLQDLATAAEQLELVPPTQEAPIPVVEHSAPSVSDSVNPQFAEIGFEEQTRQIRRILDQYRNMPDYYGPPWQLRRTFEPIHAERVSNWFFTQGGRGALRNMGSRLQNILVASGIISVLRDLYGTRVRTLVLANSPERLGEWRRGLQDCLGIDRRDFSADRGVALFEDAEVLAQKADRLIKQGKLPMIVIDDTEDKVSLSMLQFPLWLAFAPEPLSQNSVDRF